MIRWKFRINWTYIRSVKQHLDNQEELQNEMNVSPLKLAEATRAHALWSPQRKGLSNVLGFICSVHIGLIHPWCRAAFGFPISSQSESRFEGYGLSKIAFLDLCHIATSNRPFSDYWDKFRTCSSFHLTAVFLKTATNTVDSASSRL